MRHILFGALATALCCISGDLWAWGQNGHRVIGKIAAHHLTPTTQSAVSRLLGEDTLAEVSTWADEMRSSQDEMWQNMNHWHYINIEKAGEFVPSTYQINTLTPDSQITDVYAAVLKSIAILKSPQSSQQQQAFHLKLLTHMVGDIHQPMHAGHRHDKGGNDVNVEFFGELTNLHSLWDTKLLQSQNLSFTEMAEFIDTRNHQFIEKSQSNSPAEWVLESYQLAQNIYQQPRTSLSYRYVYDYMPVANEQLLKAGIRLAGLLNQIFDSPDSQAVSHKTEDTGQSNLSTHKNNR
ncbi:S1/P1 nuclease [Shewanella sp. GXUN23E]|uniref:S1/P1 nuclease n=1 Tax=Shewanella sp. GXUN23E TaxID=3422498 RepID=UPI003D7EC5C0